MKNFQESEVLETLSIGFFYCIYNYTNKTVIINLSKNLRVSLLKTMIGVGNIENENIKLICNMCSIKHQL